MNGTAHLFLYYAKTEEKCYVTHCRCSKFFHERKSRFNITSEGRKAQVHWIYARQLVLLLRNACLKVITHFVRAHTHKQTNPLYTRTGVAHLMNAKHKMSWMVWNHANLDFSGCCIYTAPCWRPQSRLSGCLSPCSPLNLCCRSHCECNELRAAETREEESPRQWMLILPLRCRDGSYCWHIFCALNESHICFSHASEFPYFGRSWTIKHLCRSPLLKTWEHLQGKQPRPPGET